MSTVSKIDIHPTAMLNTYLDWTKWFLRVKSRAECFSIWKYVDPFTESPITLEKPERQLPSRRSPQSALSASEECDLFDLMAECYRLDMQEFEELQQQLQNFNAYIIQSICPSFRGRFDYFSSPRETLKILKEIFWPGKWLEIQMAEKFFQQLIRQNIQQVNIDQWLADIVEAFCTCEYLGTQRHIRLYQLDLLDAIATLPRFSYFVESERERFRMEERQDKDLEQLTAHDFIKLARWIGTYKWRENFSLSTPVEESQGQQKKKWKPRRKRKSNKNKNT